MGAIKFGIDKPLNKMNLRDSVRTITVEVEKIVEVPVEKIIKEYYPVETVIEIEKRVEVPVEVIKTVEVEKIIEKVIEVPRLIEVPRVPSYMILLTAVEFVIILTLLIF